MYRVIGLPVVYRDGFATDDKAIEWFSNDTDGPRDFASPIAFEATGDNVHKHLPDIVPEPLLRQWAAKEGGGIVFVMRHPDASNEFQTFGAETEIIDVDYGAVDLHDEDEFKSWAESHEERAAGLFSHNDVASVKAAGFLWGLVAEAREHYGHS